MATRTGLLGGASGVSITFIGVTSGVSITFTR